MFIVNFLDHIWGIKTMIHSLAGNFQIGKRKYLQSHIGGHDNIHNGASQNCKGMLNQKQHIETFFADQSI